MNKVCGQLCAAVMATGITFSACLTATSSPAYAAKLRTVPVTARPSGGPGFKAARPAAIRPGVVTVTTALQNQATFLCLDDSAQFGLRTFGCNLPSYNAGYQKWFLIEKVPGFVQMQNAKTNLCADDSVQFGLRDFPCNDPSFKGGFQAWAVVTPRGGTNPISLQNVATKLCLDDSNDFGLRGFGCNLASYDSGFQKWLMGTPTH